MTCGTAKVEASERRFQDKALFHVGHDAGARLPARIGCVANSGNRDEMQAGDADQDFPKILGLLSVSGGQLHLALRNRGTTPLRKVRVTWRLPLGWSPGVKAEPLADVLPEADALATLKPAPVGDDRYQVGAAFFVAQVDFVQDGDAGRIHFTCRGDEVYPEQYWPREGFSVLGPIPADEFSSKEVAARFQAEGCPESWRLGDGSELKWRPRARDGYIEQAWLDPEYIRTMGTWDPASPAYMLRSRIHSPTTRPVGFYCGEDHVEAIYLNGLRVVGFRGELQQGDNDLVLVYRAQKLDSSFVRLAACFLRLTDPANGERLGDIAYHPWQNVGTQARRDEIQSIPIASAHEK
jgi:hypothetical protein